MAAHNEIWAACDSSANYNLTTEHPSSGPRRICELNLGTAFSPAECSKNPCRFADPLTKFFTKQVDRMDKRLKSRLRRKRFVSREIQGNLLRRLAVYWFIYHFVLWHTMFLYRYLEYRGWLFAGATPLTFRELYTAFAIQHYSVLVCAVAIFPVVLWDMLKMTHRVAGPMVRMRNELRRLTRGERVAPVRLRHDDMLTDFVAAFNEFVASRAAEPCPSNSMPGSQADESASSAEGELLENVHGLQAEVVPETDRTATERIAEPASFEEATAATQSAEHSASTPS